MVVCQQIREEGELVDDLHVSAGQVDVSDDPRGTPPPQVALRNPGRLERWRLAQLLQVQPAPKVGHHAPVGLVLPENVPGVQYVQNPLQVAGDQDEDRRQQRHNHSDSPATRCEQVVEQGVASERDERKPECIRQIEGQSAGHAGQPGQQGDQDVTKVVVGNAIAGKPGVDWRVGIGSQDAIEKRQLHRLLGELDFGVVGPHEGPEQKAAGVDGLHPQHSATIAAQPLTNLVPFSKCQTKRSHQEHRAKRSPAAVRHEAETGTQPQQVAGGHEPDGPSEGIASIGKPVKDTIDDGEGQQAEDSAGQPPGEPGEDQERTS